MFVYIVEDSQYRSNPLLINIRMGFMVNLSIWFFIIVIDHNRGDYRETASCKATGYFIQYFGLSFYLWINSMSFNIWNTFSNPKGYHLDDKKKFIGHLFYAQGLPIIIVLITFIIDEAKPWSEDLLPNV